MKLDIDISAMTVADLLAAIASDEPAPGAGAAAAIALALGLACARKALRIRRRCNSSSLRCLDGEQNRPHDLGNCERLMDDRASTVRAAESEIIRAG